MGGSQLSQLKAALHSSGVTGHQQNGGKGKKRQHGGGARKNGGMVDEDARKKKLEVRKLGQSMSPLLTQADTSFLT